MLTYRSQVTYTSLNYAIIASNDGFISNCVNRCWDIINWTIGKHFSDIWSKYNNFDTRKFLKNIICQTVAMLSRCESVRCFIITTYWEIWSRVCCASCCLLVSSVYSEFVWLTFIYLSRFLSWQWTCYQIRETAGCTCAGNAENVFPTTDVKGNR